MRLQNDNQPVHEASLAATHLNVSDRILHVSSSTELVLFEPAAEAGGIFAQPFFMYCIQNLAAKRNF